jgi:type VI protein secretion system component Hcp
MLIVVNIKEIPGESKVAGYLDQIECLSFAIHADVARSETTGLAIGLPKQSPLVITKQWDKASTQLALAIGGPVPFALELTCLQPVPGALFEAFKLKLTNARVIDYQHAANEGGAHLPVEQVTFSFDTVDYTIKPPPK